MSGLTIDSTRLLPLTLECESKIGVHEGSSGSSKTVSICQAFLTWSFQEKEKLYTIGRETFPALRRGAMRDWKRVLTWANAHDRFKLNKTDHTWTNIQTGTSIEFTAFDHEQKARGPRRDRLWVNEANELPYETFRQLLIRTQGQTWIDYNPSMQRHWIYDNVLSRDDVTWIHSTYKDNRFLTDEEIREILEPVPVYEEADGTIVKDYDLTYTGDGVLVKGDPYQYGVFALGLRGAPAEAIYPTVHIGAFPDADFVYGLDFGYTHPAVLMRVARVDGDPPALHGDQIIHESYLTTSDLIARIDAAGVDKRVPMYCDAANPEAIEEIRRAGYNALPADKSPGSVYSGILHVKGHKIILTTRSERSRDQFVDYRWKKTTAGIVLDAPSKVNDDAPDALRYAAFTHWRRPAIDHTRV